MTLKAKNNQIGDKKKKQPVPKPKPKNSPQLEKQTKSPEAKIIIPSNTNSIINYVVAPFPGSKNSTASAELVTTPDNLVSSLLWKTAGQLNIPVQPLVVPNFNGVSPVETFFVFTLTKQTSNVVFTIYEYDIANLNLYKQNPSLITPIQTYTSQNVIGSNNISLGVTVDYIYNNNTYIVNFEVILTTENGRSFSVLYNEVSTAAVFRFFTAVRPLVANDVRINLYLFQECTSDYDYCTTWSRNPEQTVFQSKPFIPMVIYQS